MAKLVNLVEKTKGKSSSELQQTAKKRKDSMESAKKKLAEQDTSTSSSGNSFAQFVQQKKAQQSSKSYSGASAYTDGMTFSEYAQKKKEQKNAPIYTEGMDFSEYVARKKGLITDEPESASTSKWEWGIGANDIVDERVNSYLNSDYTNVKNKLRDAKSRYNMLGSRGMLNAEERSELKAQIADLEAQLEGLEKPETRISAADYVAQTVDDDAVTAEATASQKENAAQIAALKQALAKGDNSRTLNGRSALLRQDLNQYDTLGDTSEMRANLGELTGGKSLLEDYDREIMALAQKISDQQAKADTLNKRANNSNTDTFRSWDQSDWESEVPETKERAAANSLQSQLDVLYKKRDTLDAEYAAARDSSDLYSAATAQAAVQRLETAESSLNNLTTQIANLEAQLKTANKAADKADKAAKNDYYTAKQAEISNAAQLKGKASSDAYAKLEELQSELAEMKKNKPKSAAQALANQREKQAQAKLDEWVADTQAEADELSALLQPYADSGQLDDPSWERPAEVKAALKRSEELSRERQELQQAIDDAGSIGAKDSNESIVKSYWAQRGNEDYAETVTNARSEMADADSPYLDPYGFYQKNKTRIDTLATDNDSFGSLTADETYFAKNYDRFGLFQFMTAAEVNDYYYQLAKGGVDQAKEYLDAMEVTLDQRRVSYNQANTQITYGTSGLGGKAAMNVLSVPANVAGGITAAVGDALSTAEGKYNPYSPYHNLQDYANDTRSITANEISSRTYAATGSEGLANLASNTYQALMSSGDSLFGAAVLGKGYTITMGMGAASQRARELYEDGASEGEIAAIALAAGAIEVITEEHSIESFTSKFLDGNITGLKSAVKNILIQSMNEASEEMVSEITNKIVDSMIRGADSDHSKDIQQIMEEQGCSREEAERIAFVNDAVDVLWAGYGGAVSGGAMAAGGTIINATTSGARKTGKQLAESGEAESVLQNAKELGNNSKTVDKLLQKVRSGKTLSGSDYAKLTNVLDSNVKAMVEADTESVKSAVQARADELGVKRSGILASAITNDLLGADLSAKEKIVRAANKEAANQIINELNTSLFSDTESNAWVKEIKTYQIGKGVFTAKKTAARTAAEETIESTAKDTFGKRVSTVTALYNDGQNRTAYTSEMTAVYKAAQDGKAISSVKADTLTATQKQAAYLLGQQARMNTDAYSYSEDGDSSYVRSTNEAVQVVGFSATGSKAVLTTADGSTVNASDVVFGDYGEASLYRSISNLNIEADSANEILNQIRNGKLSDSEAAMAINDAYTVGRLGNAFSSIRESSEAGKLSEDVREAAWQAGRDAAAKNDKAKAELARNGKHAAKKGSLTIEQSARSIKRNAQQKTAVQAAAILRDMGMNISVYASTEADRAAGMENGCITLADGSIRVDLNAGVDGSGVMAYALSHELTHFAEEFSAEKFRTFTDILFAEMESKDVNVQNLIESKKLDAPKGYTGEKLNEWAYSEAVAEMCETMLTDTDALTRISQKLHAKDAKLWTKIKDFLQGLAERLKAAYKGLEPDSDIAKVAKEAITSSEKVLEAYADAVADAAENYRNGGKNVEAAEAEKILKSGRQETKNLVALHNLTEDKFLKTLELGGFPMPSIAVTKADIPHTAFGDITVVFGKETIDPRANRKNAVYSADAWTPVVPNVEYEVNSSAESRISEKLGDLSGKVDEEFQRGLRQLTSDIEGDMNRNGGEEGLIKKALGNYSLKAAYLEEQGKHVEVPTRQETTQANQVSEAMQRRYAQVADVLGVTTADEAKHLTLKEARDQHGAELEQVWPGIAKSALRLSTALNRIADMFDGKLNQTETKTVKDAAAARANIDRAIDSKAYEAWVRDLYQGIEAGSGIYNGKERYTPAGDLKSFKATHIPATLDGIVKAMASENGGNTKNVSGFHGVKTLRAATAQTFKSIAQMHGAQGRLQNLTQEQADKITDTLGSSMYQVMSTIDSANEGSMSSSNNLIRMGNIGEILVEVGESGKYTPENVQAIFREHGLNVDAQAAQKTVELLYEISQMPVNIFEAKPARAVAFSEIKSVIVPDSASTKLLDALNEKGIPYQTYEAGHDEQRVQMVQDMDEVRFSLRGKAAPTREELEKKAPVNVVDISKAQTKGSFSERRKAILRDAQETIKKPYLNKDTGTMIFLTKKSYTHLFSNVGEIQLNAAEHLPEFVENAILTHAEDPTHGSEYANRVYTFFAAAGGNDGVKPVKLKVKEYSYKAQQLPANVAEYFQNSGGDYAGVYDTVVLAVEDIEKDLPGSARPLTDKSASMQRPDKSSTIRVADLLNLVKGDTEKYIPQTEPDVNGEVLKSSRKPNPEAYDAEEWGDGRYMPTGWDEDTNVLQPSEASAEGIDFEDTSDLPFFFGDEETKATSRKTKNGKTQEEKLGEIKKAQKAARKIRKQADYLQRVLRIQKSGNLEVKAAAKELMQANRVNGDVNELSSLLQSFYQRMQRGKGEDGEAYTQADMEADLNEIADWIESREVIELDSAAEEVLGTLRGMKIKLNKQQLGNIKHEFGSLREFKRQLQRIVTVDQKNGIELDSRWEELADMYPSFFREKEKLGNSDTDTNLPAMLVDAIDSLLKTKSTDQLRQDEFAGEARADLIESILEKGWNVIPEESVTDKYRQQIRDLKQEQEKAISEMEAQQRSRIAEIQAELAARLEEQKQQAHESYDRMKEIYDAERQKIAEAHKAELNELRETYAGRTAEYQEEALNYLNALDDLENKSEGELRSYLKDIAKKLSEGDKDAYSARIGQYGKVINEYVDLRALDSQKNAAYNELKRRSDAQRKKAQERVESAKRKEAAGKLFRVQNQLNRMLMNPSKTLYVPDSMKNALTKAMQVLLETETNDLNGRKAKKSALLAELAEMNKNPAKNASAIAEVEEKLEKLAAKSTTVTDALQDLLTAYKQMSAENEGRFTSERDEDIAAFVYDAVTAVGGKPFYQLSSGQIEAVYQAYKAILTTIRNENKLFAENLKAGYTETAKAALGELRGQPSRASSKGRLAETAEKFSWNNEKPIYAFMRLGSSTMTKLYQNMRNGEDSFAVDISEGQAFVTEAMKKYGYQKFEDKPLTLTSADGKAFSLNLEERMSLYAYSKREQAIDHLTEGGIVLAENETETKGLFGRKKKVQNEDFNSYRLTKEQAQAIRDSNLLQLTKEQQAFADEMQGYLSTVCAAKNNEVSLKLYGVTKFHEKFYWPIKSSGIFSESIRESQERTGNKQKNAGFTKGTVKHARNPINLNGFMETWSQHVINTAMYHSFTLPMEDFYRVYNYKESAKGTEVRGLRQEILAKHGAAATGYIDQFLKDVNGGVRADPRSSAVNMLLGGFKKAAVSASLSVAIQQPSSVGRSFAYINPQYFFGARVDSVGGINKTWEEMKQYAPVTILKEMGRFDVGVSAGTKDMLMNGKKGFLESMDEWFGKAPEFMDKITWVAMWNACKRQTKAQNRSLTGETLKQEAGKLFTKVITETQVYDSTFSRSGNMRSKDTGMTMLTAFMAEPTTTANMVTQALRDWKQGYKGKATRAVTAVGAATILNSMLASLVYASRDDDEDKTWLEKYLKSLVSELLDGANPLGYIPGVKDIWSLFQGYDVERSDMSLWAEVVDQAGSFANAAKSLQSTDPEDEEAMTEAWKTFGEKSADAAASVLNLFGIPLKNILREVGGAKNIVNDIQNPKKQDAATIGHAMWEGFNEYLPDIFRQADGKTQEVYKAMSSGSEAWIERVKSTYASEDKYNTAVVNALKSQDGRIKQIAQAQIDGDSKTESKLKKAILSEGGFTEDQIDSAIEKQRSKLKGGSADSLKEMYLSGEITASEARNRLVNIVGKKADTAESTVTSWQCERDTGVAYSDMKDAYIGGELSQSKAEQMLVKYGGKSADAAETQVLKWQCERDTGVEYDDLKDAYLDGDITGTELTKALQKYGGKTEEEAEETLTVCQWQKKHPSSTMTASQISKYTTAITSVGGSPESLGISEKTYQSYLSGMSKCTGTDANNDGKTDSGSKKAQVLALIDSLDLTSAQKDALYYSEGYAASKLKNAPWH